MPTATPESNSAAVDEHGPLRLAALRGEFGTWAFYVAMIPVGELRNRVHFAEEIHKDKRLAEMMQRRVKLGRGKEVAEYLATAKERFFNALVVAVYKGEPRWHELALRNSVDASLSVGDLGLQVRGAVGILTLNGKERLFALDGQHRLAGIRLALDAQTIKDTEEVAIVCVGHTPDPAGMERTRRLFTTLNKKAKPVRLADIIALDEDDLAAICARRLVDEYPAFMGDRTAIKANNIIAKADASALTTISTLFQVARYMFRHLRPDVRKKYGSNRPPEEVVDDLYNLVVCFFDALARERPEFAEFVKATNPAAVTKKYRDSHALYRPIGLEIFAEVAAKRAARLSVSIDVAVSDVAKLPFHLGKPPFRGLFWDPTTSTVIPKNRALTRDLIAFAMSEHVRRSPQQLQAAVDERAKGKAFRVASLRSKSA
jgi:DNA sulfur modification protein DndB